MHWPSSRGTFAQRSDGFIANFTSQSTITYSTYCDLSNIPSDIAILKVAKNIVLAGVGSVTLVDDTDCSAGASGNFLLPHDAKDQTVAEACVATLREMNPLVSVAAINESPETFLNANKFAGYNIVVVIGQSGAGVDAADRACTETGVPLIAASNRGLAGWAFANLHTHDYVIEASLRAHLGVFQGFKYITICII